MIVEYVDLDAPFPVMAAQLNELADRMDAVLSDREEAVLKERLSGATFAEMAQTWRLSLERMRQITFRALYRVTQGVYREPNYVWYGHD